MKKIIIIIISTIIFSGIFSVKAADNNKIELTVSPPLVKINMEPGQSWSSSIRVANNNSASVTVYAQAFDFKNKDNGAVEFIQNTGNDNKQTKYSLSQWINIGQDGIVIAPQKSVDIPYTIKLPENTEPGGHYAAILTGTKAPDKIQGSGIGISSMISSLIMLKVKGDIKEQGRILEFITDKSLYKNPDANFAVKFENLGNVHVQPRGDIRVYDYYNKEVGIIEINKGTEFGNVLPGTSRKWNFDWKGEEGLTHMGRYKADLVLSYGDQAKQTDNRSIYFWVVNLKVVGIILGSIILFIGLLVFFIKLYVKRVVIKTQKEAALIMSLDRQNNLETPSVPDKGIVAEANAAEPKKRGRKKATRGV